MDIVRILAIAPYENLRDMLINAAELHPNIKVDVFCGNLEQGIQYAKNYCNNDYDIFISRGGTAKLLRDISDIPVIEIDVSIYDMLRLIKIAQQYNQPFAIIGFSNITKTSKMLCDILGYQIPIIEISNEADCTNKLKELYAKKITLVLGDVITVSYANKMGINGLLITSGVNSIEKAYYDAIAMYRNLKYQKEYINLFRNALDLNRASISLFDSKKELIYSNKKIKTLSLLISKSRYHSTLTVCKAKIQSDL